ncbi:MAG: class I SAM-dependent methyltransferase [Bacteroidota bacterium]
MSDDFEPRKHVAPIGTLNKISFIARLLVDFQVLTVYKNIKKFSTTISGNLLDFGCGSSPYKHLFSNKNINYFGLDTIDAADFKYHNKEVTIYDGQTIPFETEFFDGFICTEVMEHIFDYSNFASEIFRILKKDGIGIITIPWSSRYHYVPFDYFRFTPSAIKKIFCNFSNITVIPRGTDITVISSKIILIYFRNLLSKNFIITFLFLPVFLLFAPLILILLFIGHLSILAKIGSKDDPLGYTILLKK